MNKEGLKSYSEKVKNKINKYVEENYSSIIGHVNEDELLHIKQLAANVLMTRDSVIQGDSFVQAIITNNLEKAISSADEAALKAIKLFVQVKLWCFIK